MAQIRQSMRDGKAWTGLGVVRQFPGESSHFDIEGAEVLVDVELVPNGERILCRLAAAGGGGYWTIPAIGEEVAVVIPEGDVEADPVIVGTLSDAPAGVAVDRVVIVRAGVRVLADNIELGGADLVPLTAGVVVAAGVDPFTGATYGTLNNHSTVVKARKV
jgi:hypothetical protein